MAEYTCLIVEDSPMMRQLLVFALSRLKNLSVLEADDGVDALKKLAAGRFDIIIADINMPIMDGLKLVKRIRSDAVHRDGPDWVVQSQSIEEHDAVDHDDAGGRPDVDRRARADHGARRRDADEARQGAVEGERQVGLA